MKIITDVFYIRATGWFGDKVFASWQLWFTEAENNPYRHMHVEEHTFPVKPTKKQIRRLRRRFRNFSML